MIKISLILPVYNTSSYLEKCVVSCESQNLTKDEFEVIIVNDGSTDNSLQIAKDLEQKYDNVVILDQSNQGLSMARNNGTEIARGEYLWFIDSDDFIAKNCIKEIVEIMDAKQLDMFGVGPSIPFRESFPADFDRDRQLTKVYNGEEWILHGMAFIGAWAYVFRKTFFQSLDFGFYPGIYFEDTEFMPKAFFMAGRICSLSDLSCYSYVQRPGSIMNSPYTEKKINDIGKIVNSFSDFIKTHNLTGEIRLKFQHILSQQYMAGLVGISKIKSPTLLKTWVSTIPKEQLLIYGKNIMEKIFQFIAFKSPKSFYFLKNSWGGVSYEIGNKHIKGHLCLDCCSISFGWKMPTNLRTARRILSIYKSPYMQFTLYNTFAVILGLISVFYLSSMFCVKCPHETKLSKLIISFADYSMGIYIIHFWLLTYTTSTIALTITGCLGNPSSSYKVCMVALISCATFVLSYLFTRVIKKSQYSQYVIG